MTAQPAHTDEQVAAWVPTQNRGTPPWPALSEGARALWRRAYEQRQREGS